MVRSDNGRESSSRALMIALRWQFGAAVLRRVGCRMPPVTRPPDLGRLYALRHGTGGCTAPAPSILIPRGSWFADSLTSTSAVDVWPRIDAASVGPVFQTRPGTTLLTPSYSATRPTTGLEASGLFEEVLNARLPTARFLAYSGGNQGASLRGKPRCARRSARCGRYLRIRIRLGGKTMFTNRETS